MHFITFSKGTEKIIVSILRIDIALFIFFYYFRIYLFPVGCRILSVLCNNLCLGLRSRRFCFVCSPAHLKRLCISAGEVACIAIYFTALLETYTPRLLNNKGLLRSYSDNKQEAQRRLCSYIYECLDCNSKTLGADIQQSLQASRASGS